MGILVVSYSIQLTPDDLRIIGTALDERPYKEVAALCARIQVQINEQDKPKEAEESSS
jgi:hypothetical protein